MVAFLSWLTCIVPVLCELTGGWFPQHTKKANKFAAADYCLAVRALFFVPAETQMGPFWVCEREQLYNINR